MKKVIVFACFWVVAACSALPLVSFDVADYRDAAPVDLKADSFRIESDVMQYDRPPHIEYKMPVTPEQALKNWAQNRFSAQDETSSLQAVFVIKEASMTRRRRSSENWYTFDNMEYTLTFQVELVFIDQAGKTRYRLSVGGHEMKAVPRKSAPATKERAWLDMMNNMIHKVNDRLIGDLPTAYRTTD